MKKRILALVLALVMLCSLGVSAFAADEPTVTVGSVTAKAGDTVVVPVSIKDNPASGIATMNLQLVPTDGLTLKDALADMEDYNTENGTSYANGILTKFTIVPNEKTGKMIGYMYPKTVKGDGVMFYMIVKLADDMAAGTYSIGVQQATNTSCIFSDDADEPNKIGATFNAGTLTVKAADAGDYNVEVKGDSNITVGADASVSVEVTSDKYDHFNASQFEISYDASVISYKGIDKTDYIVKETTPGLLKIIGYGADKSTGTAFTLTFTGKAVGNTDISINSAKIDEKVGSVGGNAPEATVLGKSSVISVLGYKVTLDDYVTGNEIASPDSDYTFAAKDAENYDYNPTITIDGVDKSDSLKDNGDGTYTIPKDLITGDIVVKSNRTAKEYNVTVDGTGKDDVKNAAAKAVYGTDYSFDLDKDSDYEYSVSITMGGNAYTGFGTADNKYTIPGADIKGDIVITVTKTVIPSQNVSVSFEGDGAGDATGDASVKSGTDYTFTLNKDASYTYTVSAKMGNNDVEVTDNGDGTYTIKNVTEDLVITITKTLTTGDINVYEYVKLDGKSMFLITVDGAPAEGKNFLYDGNAMFKSEKYNGYAYLVISDKSLDTVKTEAAGLITMADGTAVNVDYSGDVNITGLVDVNDAQLVYNMYNAAYADFTSVSMEKFLRADMNGSHNLTVEDSAAIVDIFLG